MNTRHNRALILDGIKTEKELCSIIEQTTDLLANRHKNYMKELNGFILSPGHNLDKLARIAELKIQIRELQSLKHELLIILRRSTNKMIIASIELRSYDN